MSDIPDIDGPRAGPGPGEAKKLVILSHGYGADGHDLIMLAKEWAKDLPETHFVAPHAPERSAVHPAGRQWFPITDFSPAERLSGARKAAPVLNKFIDSELEKFKLSPADLVLSGFSQGTMMSLFVGFRREEAVAGILGYSGVLIGVAETREEMKSKPPVMLIHGEVDPLLPVNLHHMSVDALKMLKVPFKSHVSKGIPHAIGPDGIDLGRDFLRDIFDGSFEANTGPNSGA